jgi:hypothetical protein
VLKPASPEDLYNKVLACKPSLTSLVVNKKDGWGNIIPNQWTITSAEEYRALPEFNWYQVFNLTGYVLPPKPPSKAEQKRQRQAAHAKWWAELVANQPSLSSSNKVSGLFSVAIFFPRLF